MRQKSKTYSVASTLVLLVLLAPPAAFGQTAVANPAKPVQRVAQTASQSTRVAPPLTSQTPSTIASPRPRGIIDALTGQTYGLDRQTPLSTALVVLAREASQANLGSLTEDLNIMCRIFDRTLTRASLRNDERDVFHFLIGTQGRDWGDRLLGNSSTWTECLYIEGYGPLFMIGVDFPFVAPAPIQEMAEPNEPSDPVWAEVSRGLYAPPGNRRPVPDTAGLAYNPEKVLSLKRAIARALKHAANIRGLTPETHVTVLVKGKQTTASAAQLGVSSNTVQTNMPLLTPAFKRATRTSLLVIRASVKDINEFAAGTLSAGQFEARIQNIVY